MGNAKLNLGPVYNDPSFPVHLTLEQWLLSHERSLRPHADGQARSITLHSLDTVTGDARTHERAVFITNLPTRTPGNVS